MGIEKVEAEYNGEATYIKNIGGVDYEILEFKSNGTFIVPANVTSVDVTVVGGGGGGGTLDSVSVQGGGGGGGGGYVTNSYNIVVTPGQAISVTVGSGGAVYQNGGQSNFGIDIIANGGSRGLKAYGGINDHAGTGGNGGSGGGGGGAWDRDGGNGGTNGGNGTDGGNRASDDVGGVGGTGQGTTTVGVNGIRYGGGGGGGAGGSMPTTTKGYGGSGGGGRGAYGDGTVGVNAAQGAPNTGGGGGGAGGNGINVAAPGGSGIVIVRWLANLNPTLNITSPSPNGTLQVQKFI